jgi:hypothetical protein
MGFLSWFFGRRPAPVPPPPPKWPVTRTIAFEWREAGGALVSFETRMLVEEDGGMTTTVPQAPGGDLGNVREESSSYPVEIISRRRVNGGFELKLGYLWEGRRREKRVTASGPALVESEGKALQAEVLNVSSGGMQLFSHDALKPGNTARIKGIKTERLALVRYCSPVPGGFHIGLQFFGDNTPPAR